MKKIFLLILFSTYYSLAQNNINSNAINTFDKSINESIYLHLSSNSVLVGETIFYKLYCLNSYNHNFSNDSKICYVEVIDSSGKSIIKQKLLLEKGVAQGDIFIPTTLNSGSYKIIGYSNWMQNYNTSNFFESNIAIINPYQSKLELPKFNYIKPTTSKNSLINISTDKKIYSTREKVELTFDNQIKEIERGQYSISIKKIDSLIENGSINSEKFISSIKTKKELKNNPSKLPEIRGEIIIGKITAIDGISSVAGKTISLSIPGKSFELKLINTDKKGNFTFILDALPNSSNAIFQVMDDNRKAYKIELTNSTFSSSKFDFPEIKAISNEQKSIIEKRSIANQIENAFFSIKKDTIKDPLNSKPFYSPLEKTISLDDYTRFSKLKETIIEILPNIFFREKDGIITINLRDKESNGIESGYTLVLVDGLVIQDVKELFEYSTKNIDKVDYITEKYAFGPKIFNGVINFITKEFSYELKESGAYILKTELQRPLNKKYYYHQNYTDVSKYERIPDYRYQLLWLPDLNFDKTISFYTSDIKGTFEISIEGFTDKGQPISIKEYFEVK